MAYILNRGSLSPILGSRIGADARSGFFRGQDKRTWLWNPFERRLRSGKVMPKLKATADFQESGYSALRAGPVSPSTGESIRTSQGKIALGGNVSPFVKSITNPSSGFGSATTTPTIPAPITPAVESQTEILNKKKKKKEEPAQISAPIQTSPNTFETPEAAARPTAPAASKTTATKRKRNLTFLAPRRPTSVFRRGGF